MNTAFHFSGLVAKYFQGQYVDTCSTIILYGADEESSRKVFETSLLNDKTGEHEAPNKIEKIVVAPVLDQLLTENGPTPIGWPELAAEARRVLEATPIDCDDQGYWIDCDQAVRPESLAPDLSWLQRELPEEYRSGLNWSADKTYFFLISVLSPPPVPGEQVEEIDERMRTDRDREIEEEGLEDFPDSGVDHRLMAFPQFAPKELTVLVRARNSVVAAWLWRRHAAGKQLAANAIRLDTLCEIAPIDA